MAAGNELAVARGQQRSDAARVPLACVEQLTLGDVPNAHQLIVTGSGEGFAVGSKRDSQGRATGTQGADELGVVAIPNPDCAIAAGRGQAGVVGGKCQGVDFIEMALELGDDFSSQQLPQDDGAILAS